MNSKKSVCIVGAGVVGLSMCCKLLEKCGNDVTITIISETFTHQTTTFGSAGFWEPYQILGTSDELINKWGKHSFDYFLGLYYSPEASDVGVRLMQVYRLLTEDEVSTFQLPSWRHIGLNFTMLESNDLLKMLLPSRFVKGYTYTSLTVDQKYYLNYLMKYITSKNVTIIQKKIQSLDELDSYNYDAIINCTGLGSSHIVEDTQMYPIRGQVLRIKAPWVSNIWFWGKSYIIPNIDHVVLGGTADKGEWDAQVSYSETNRIVHDACEIFPSIQNCLVENTWVGLRPGRTSVRLEKEVKKIYHTEENSTHSSTPVEVGSRPIFHCYGHGGSGVTLAMGCAEDLITNYFIPHFNLYTK